MFFPHSTYNYVTCILRKIGPSQDTLAQWLHDRMLHNKDPTSGCKLIAMLCQPSGGHMPPG